MKVLLSTSLLILLQAVAVSELPIDLLDKISTTGLSLLVAWFLYRELKKERETSRLDISKKEEAWHLERKELLKDLMNRLDEQRFQVNDLVKLLTKKNNSNNNQIE